MIPESKPILKIEIKLLDLKYEDVVFERPDSSDDNITVDYSVSDTETAVFNNLSDNETKMSETLQDAETGFYGLSDAETIDHISDIELIKKVAQHPKKWMKRKLKDKLKKKKH